VPQYCSWHSSDVHGNHVQHSSANACVIVAAAVAAALSAVKNLTHAQNCVTNSVTPLVNTSASMCMLTVQLNVAHSSHNPVRAATQMVYFTVCFLLQCV
jgi:hypothetical protein